MNIRTGVASARSRRRSSHGVFTKRIAARITIITAASIATSIAISTGARELLGNFLRIGASGWESSPSEDLGPGMTEEWDRIGGVITSFSPDASPRYGRPVRTNHNDGSPGKRPAVCELAHTH